ncbi:EamA family transporter [Thioalkalivibrio sp. XN8]|uniref:EamA family transporter n=1 Tax=Thioalkalivibrio sp. XN8 TaxID=2712863 RepID=UPI0013EB325A|nr:EamA family transporter [Thioalkalivibrio sp. XN8]NGP53832.1 EamA family transporter [Thioalkalivibrio sp. XN8]
MDPVASRLALVAAFAVVYLVWGSTYLAIRIAVQDLPPGLLAGVRFLLAGLILGAVALARGQRPPRTLADWRTAAVLGLAFIVLANGVVTWAEQWVPSNQAALIVASGALFTAWFGTFGRRGVPLSASTRLGLLAGLCGTALMVWPEASGPDPEGELFWPKVAIFLSTIAWSWGTMYSRNTEVSVRPLMFIACQMLVGGAVLVVAGVLSGELARWQWTLPGIGGLLYLTVFGSCIAYATYMWLIRQTTPARLGTIAYVNPAIATLLGWWLLDEALTRLQLAGMAVIIAAVAWVSISARAVGRR